MIPVPGIYMIRNTHSGCTYIGSSGNVAKRWDSHKAALSRGDHPNKALQHDWLRLGEPSFFASLLEPVPPSGPRLADAEKRWITWCKQAHVPLYSVSAARPVDTQVVTLPGLLRQRLRAALTQQQLADRAGVQKQTVMRLEHGGDTRPTTIRKLADALGCEPADLLEPPQ